MTETQEHPENEGQELTILCLLSRRDLGGTEDIYEVLGSAAFVSASACGFAHVHLGTHGVQRCQIPWSCSYITGSWEAPFQGPIVYSPPKE